MPIEIPWEFEDALEQNTRDMSGAPGENYWQQFVEYSITASIDTLTHTLTGSMKATYHNNSPYDLYSLHLELAQNVHAEGAIRIREKEVTGGKNIHRVKANGREMKDEISSDFNYFLVDGTQLNLYLDEPVVSGGKADIEIDWSFEIPKQGAGGRMGRTDDLYYIGYWYPHFSVFDDVYGWMTDLFRGNAEFYHGFADYDLSITMPADWMVIATGEPLSMESNLNPHIHERYLASKGSDEPIHIIKKEDFGNAMKPSENGTHTWKFRAEMVRDVAFSATRKSMWDAARTPVGDLTGNGETDFTHINAFYRETAPLWKESVRYGQHSITFLSQMHAFPYPWPHMTAVEGQGIIGGGMEFPMMTLISDYNMLGPERLYGVTAHEIAHMWFPMIVSTNERRYTWLDEGNTVFATDEARKDFYPDVDKHAGTQFSYVNFVISGREGEMMRWSDFHYTMPAYWMASYQKPASVLVALRGVVGEELFWEAYRTFTKEWAYKHPYPWDMWNVFERVTGMDLEWFWRSWYYETWYQNQAIADVSERGAQSMITVHDYGYVPMPVLLRITLSDGTVIDKRVSEEHWLRGNRILEVPVPYTGVKQVEIDPDFHFPDVERYLNIWQNNN